MSRCFAHSLQPPRAEGPGGTGWGGFYKSYAPCSLSNSLAATFSSPVMGRVEILENSRQRPNPSTQECDCIRRPFDGPCGRCRMTSDPCHALCSVSSPQRRLKVTGHVTELSKMGTRGESGQEGTAGPARGELRNAHVRPVVSLGPQPEGCLRISCTQVPRCQCSVRNTACHVARTRVGMTGHSLSATGCPWKAGTSGMTTPSVMRPLFSSLTGAKA